MMYNTRNMVCRVQTDDTMPSGSIPMETFWLERIPIFHKAREPQEFRLVLGVPCSSVIPTCLSPSEYDILHILFRGWLNYCDDSAHPRRSFVMAALFNFWLIVVQVVTAKRAV